LTQERNNYYEKQPNSVIKEATNESSTLVGNASNVIDAIHHQETVQEYDNQQTFFEEHQQDRMIDDSLLQKVEELNES